MSLVELPRIVPERPDRPDLGDLAATMRALTLEIATDDGAWSPERKDQIASFFDAQATTWPDRDRPERHEALHDALARGGPFPNGWCLEVGSGSGNATGDLETELGSVVSMDLSYEMLVAAPVGTRRVQADASCLPVRAASVAVVALVNVFLFPDEVARVVQPDGAVLWVSTNGDATPIYLSPAEVLDALPGTWHGVTAPAGWGTWLVARRG